MLSSVFLFFFQAEDGIRDGHVTGVQTCALPIYHIVGSLAREIRHRLPGLRLELESSALSHRGLEQILEGSLDIALGRWDLLPAEVSSRIIAHEELVLALPVGHRLASRAKVSLKEQEADRD